MSCPPWAVQEGLAKGMVFYYVTKPYELIGFGAMYVTKPYEFMGFGAMYVTKPYRFIGFGAMALQQVWFFTSGISF